MSVAFTCYVAGQRFFKWSDMPGKHRLRGSLFSENIRKTFFKLIFYTLFVQTHDGKSIPEPEEFKNIWLESFRAFRAFSQRKNDDSLVFMKKMTCELKQTRFIFLVSALGIFNVVSVNCQCQLNFLDLLTFQDYVRYILSYEAHIT